MAGAGFWDTLLEENGWVKAGPSRKVGSVFWTVSAGELHDVDRGGIRAVIYRTKKKE